MGYGGGGRRQTGDRHCEHLRPPQHEDQNTHNSSPPLPVFPTTYNINGRRITCSVIAGKYNSIRQMSINCHSVVRLNARERHAPPVTRVMSQPRRGAGIGTGIPEALQARHQ